ncbi:hypothetical protein TIFTF001_025126 [Ficus carica]|uniref:Uncharacterized protein n=1 Tax=Ficus carica TaxID=3494 RepID=A0AA88DFB1_FICCA|nr:hypothetical protein TIFTF001_025126 [Ficus carica]
MVWEKNMNGLWKDVFGEWKVLLHHLNDLVREGLPYLDRSWNEGNRSGCILGNAYSGGPLEMSPKVIVYWKGYPLLAICYGASPSIEPPEVERVTCLGQKWCVKGMVGEVENTMCSKIQCPSGKPPDLERVEEDLMATKFFLVQFGGFPLRPWCPFLSRNGCFSRRENSSVGCLNVVKEICIGNGCLER